MCRHDKNTKRLLNEWGDIEKLSVLKNEEKRIIEKTLDKSNRSIELLKEEVSRLEKEIEDNLAKRKKIVAYMHKLPEEEQRILNLRHLQKYNWTGVATKMYISERQAFNIYNRALTNLEKLLEESE